MQFADSETQGLLRTTARSYLAETFPRERLFALERGDAELSRDDLRAFAELGWFGLLAPEDVGGGGGTLLDAAALFEEFGYAAVAAPVAVANIALFLLSGLDPELARPLLRGEQLWTISEATRGGPGVVGGAEPPISVSGGRVSGTLSLVPFAALSSHVLAPAQTEDGEAYVALALAAAELEPVALLDRRGYANVNVRDMQADGVAYLATVPQTAGLRERSDALVAAFSVVELAGMMRRVLEMTSEHISTRMQFGQPIAKFQAARHRAAEMLMQVETTRWAAYHALWRYAQDGSTDEIWLTKHWAVRAAARVYEISHLLHGGVGVGMEHPLHLYTQGIAAFAVRGGTMDELVARTLASIQRSRPAEVAQ